ncbi:MAG: hypothetical protein RL414_1244 [Actinomycetota bacterium]
MAVLFGECFDGGFAIDHGGNDLAFFGSLLLADHHVIAIADREVDHGIALDLEHVNLTFADERFGKGVDLFDVLIGCNGYAGSDLADEGNVAGLFGRDGVTG